MKILITLNFAIGVLLTMSMVVFEKYELIGLLPGIVLLPSFLVLAPVNAGAIFFLWRKKHLRAFIPIGTYAIAAALFVFGTNLGTKLVWKGTPCDPRSFFNDQTKAELAGMAKQLVAEHQRNSFPSEIVAIAKKHSLEPIYADDCQGIVTFGHYHLRHWFEYIWATNGLTEPYSMDATITDADIKKWGELKRIIKQGDAATEMERRHIEFAPSIAFPFLKDNLGAEFIELARNTATNNGDLSDEDKNLVLAALNKQRLVSSALVENPQITYEKWRWNLFTYSGLCVAGSKYNDMEDGFWESKLARQLLSEGVLLYASDGRHLKIKTNLTEKQRREVEWLHVGLMNFIYGNLLSKGHYKFTKNLGGNWYFDVR